MRIRMFRFAATCVVVLYFLDNTVSRAQTARIDPAPPPQAEITLQPYVGPLKSVKVAVAGDTLPFILDTGGGFTFLTPEVAKSMGCVPYGRLTGFRHNGERIDTQRCGLASLGLGAVHISTETSVFDLMAVLKRFGDLPVVGGLVSLKTFERTPFTLDYATDKLIIESPSSLRERVKDMKPLSVRLSRQAGGAALDLFVEVAAKTGSIWLELDSGNSGPVILSKHATAQLGLDTAEGSLPVTLDVIGLGPLKFDAVVNDTIYDGLLNVQFLNDTVLSIDLAAGRAWARRHDGPLKALRPE